MSKRNSIIALLMSAVIAFAMMPVLGQVYADDYLLYADAVSDNGEVTESGGTDMYDLGSSKVTFDEKYHVLDDIKSTPYPDYFYDVPAGTKLEPIVMLNDKRLGSDCYSASYSECMFYTERNEWDKIDENNWIDHFPTDAGVYFCKVEGKGAYHGSFEWIDLIRIEKAANPLKVSGLTAKVKASKLKKSAQYLKVSKVIKFTRKGKGPMKYTLSSAKKGSKSFKKYFKINSSTGKVTVKKGLKKGTYKIKVKVQAKGNANYKASAKKNVNFIIKVQ